MATISSTPRPAYIYDSTLAVWVPIGGVQGPEGGTTTLTTKGDILTRSASAIARQAVGTDNYILMSDSTAANGISWTGTPKITTINNITGAAGTPTLWSDVTTGTIAIGGGLAAGTITIGPAGGASTGTSTYNIGSFGITTGGTRNINIGYSTTALSSGAVNNIIIGSTTLGGSSTTTLYGIVKSYLSTNAQTASYTLILADDSKLVEVNNASANNITVPLNSSVAYPIGTQINLLQTGVGQTTVVPTAITTATYSSGGAAAATTFVISATNAAILAGQRVTGTGFSDNTYVVSVATTTITVSPAITSQVSGTITFSIPVFATPGLKLRTQWSSATLIKRVADSRTSTNYPNDTWVLVGDLSA